MLSSHFNVLYTSASLTSPQPLWEEMGLGTTDLRQKEFPAFFTPSESADEEAVEAHEQYLETLRVRLEDLKPIFDRIAKREVLETINILNDILFSGYRR